MKYPKVTLGRVEAVWNKFGGEEGVDRFLRGEVTVFKPTRWREQDGIIYFSVTSDGTTGSQWVECMKAKGCHLDDFTKNLLRSENFKPTKGIITQLAVLKDTLFLKVNEKYNSGDVYAEAYKRGLEKPGVEIAFLIRKNFSDEELEAMGLSWIVTMHEHIGGGWFLTTGRSGCGNWLIPCGEAWSECGHGFAFVRPQVSKTLSL